MGGGTAAGASSTAEAYDPATNTWVSAGTASSAHSLFGTAMLPNGQAFVTAGVIGTGTSGVTDLYQWW
jgi:Kelch motif